MRNVIIAITLLAAVVLCQNPAMAVPDSYTVPGKVADLQCTSGVQLNNKYTSYSMSSNLGLVRLEIHLNEIDNNITLYDDMLGSLQSHDCWGLVLIGRTIGDTESNMDNVVNKLSAGSAKLAEHYKTKGFSKIIFELVNEPEGQGFDSSTYAKLINTAVPLIRAKNSGILICTGGLAGGDPPYVSDVLGKLNSPSLVNYIGYHSYSDNEKGVPEKTSGEPAHDHIYKLRQAIGGRPNIDLLMTERGWAPDWVNNEKLRAAYYLRVVFVHMRALVEGSVLFLDTPKKNDPMQMPQDVLDSLPLIYDAFPGNPKDFGRIAPSDASAVGVGVAIDGACVSLGRSTTGSISIALWLDQDQGTTNTADLYNIPAGLKYAQVADLANPGQGWVNKTVTKGTTNQIKGITVTHTPVIIRVSDQPFPNTIHITTIVLPKVESGTITPLNPVNPYGVNVELTATPKAGYALGRWYFDSLENKGARSDYDGSPTFPCNGFGKDHTMYHLFQFVVSTVVSPVNAGTITPPNPTVYVSNPSDTSLPLPHVDLKAIPKPGYTIGTWLFDGQPAPEFDGKDTFPCDGFGKPHTITHVFTEYPPTSLAITIDPGKGYLGVINDISLNYTLNGPQQFAGALTPDNSGTTQINGLQPGSYDLSLTGSHWLKRIIGGISVDGVNSVNTVLTNGDADGGNSIDLFDFVVLDAAFSTSNQMADLNGDGKVNLFDYVIIDQNFGALGD